MITRFPITPAEALQSLPTGWTEDERCFEMAYSLRETIRAEYGRPHTDMVRDVFLYALRLCQCFKFCSFDVFQERGQIMLPDIFIAAFTVVRLGELAPCK